jgi:hypothetical protein
MANSAHLRRYHFGCFLRVWSDCGLAAGIMAHIHDGDFGDESRGGNGGSESGSLFCAYGICDNRYVSLYYFKMACFEFYKLLEHGFESSLHLGFSHVTSRDFIAIDEAWNDLPKYTVLYDSQEEILILKFVLGIAHEFCSRLLFLAFTNVFTTGTGDQAAIDPVGAGRFMGAKRLEEGDEAFVPKIWGLESDWPNIVFEVGVWGCEILVDETFAELLLDARFWLECFGRETRVVVIVLVDRPARSIVIERWQAVPAEI